MTNAFRRTTSSTSSSSKDKVPKPTNPFVVGSQAWEKFRSTGRLPKRITRNSMYTTKKRYRRSKKVTRSQIAKNRELCDKILHFTFQNEWVQIDGGENNGCWINPKHYGNKIFKTGYIFEYSTGQTHYFPVADTYDDPVGIALNYKSIHCGGLYTSILPNTWTTVATRKSIREKKKAERMEEDHIDNRDVADKD